MEEALFRFLPKEGSAHGKILEAARYALSAGGKRLRPVLLLTASDAANGPDSDPEAALQAAAALEYLHTYTLIHDDLPSMDDDNMRRGKPSVHIAFGEDIAILAGDALQALAFETISRPTGLPPGRTLRMVGELARIAGMGGVVGGQAEDISGATIDEERLAYIQLHKTADLFSGALCLGAIAGGGDEEEIAALSESGKYLGVAFQIIDDLLDEAQDGKGEDTSCLRIWSREEALAKAKECTSYAVASLAPLRGSQPLAALSDLAGQMLARTL